jgi:hypothetical protein
MLFQYSFVSIIMFHCFMQTSAHYLLLPMSLHCTHWHSIFLKSAQWAYLQAPVSRCSRLWPVVWLLRARSSLELTTTPTSALSWQQSCSGCLIWPAVWVVCWRLAGADYLNLCSLLAAGPQLALTSCWATMHWACTIVIWRLGYHTISPSPLHST